MKSQQCSRIEKYFTKISLLCLQIDRMCLYLRRNKTNGINDNVYTKYILVVALRTTHKVVRNAVLYVYM